MVQPHPESIERIRAASRRLVRELGFMEDTLAGTDMSASGVHAIIEIGSERATTASQLATALRLEKSTVSRLLKGMIASGRVVERFDRDDGRVKRLELTDRGCSLFADISRKASGRVELALSALDEKGKEDVVRGLEGYAEALRQTEGRPSEEMASSSISIHPGYRPGFVGRTVQMHADYYSRSVGFGLAFEAKVAREMGEFVTQLDNADNAIWAALRADQIVGAVSIDGQDLGGSIAHLRWFIVGDGQRGTGIGKMLMDAAMAFVDTRGFEETHLWTFDGLQPARRLYERAGFELAEEKSGNQWGRTVLEQRFVRQQQ